MSHNSQNMSLRPKMIRDKSSFCFLVSHVTVENLLSCRHVYLSECDNFCFCASVTVTFCCFLSDFPGVKLELKCVILIVQMCIDYFYSIYVLFCFCFIVNLAINALEYDLD